MLLLTYVYVGLVGACIGSFLNVVIHRLPLQESVVRPRSRCPHCQHTIAWYHNVPVFSYLWLRGCCAFCQAPILWSYLLVEIGTALAFMGLFHVFGWSFALLRYSVLIALLIAAAEIDRKHGIIPNRLVAVGAVLGTVLLFLPGVGSIQSVVSAALASASLLLLLRWGSQRITGRPGMGMGDVKLVAIMGLYLGWGVFWGFYLAALLGGTLGLVGLLTGRLKRASRLPFAPFLAIGTALHLFLLPPDLVLPL